MHVAISEYEKKFRDKTVSGDYIKLDITYENEKDNEGFFNIDYIIYENNLEEKKKEDNVETSDKSKLPKPVKVKHYIIWFSYI